MLGSCVSFPLWDTVPPSLLQRDRSLIDIIVSFNVDFSPFWTLGSVVYVLAVLYVVGGWEW